jgi:ribosomal-protein-alanine N-acetyltransferase
MLRRLAAKLSQQRRDRILLEVRETNLPAQLFFRANGFRAISLLREYYEDSPEDAYLMQFTYESTAGDALVDENSQRRAC